MDYYNAGNIDLVSFKQGQQDLLNMSECSDDAAAILPASGQRKPSSKREPLRRMNSGGRLRNVKKAWGDLKSKIKIPGKGTKHSKWNVPQHTKTPECPPQVLRTPRSMTKQRLLDIAYSPDFFRTPEHCRIYRSSKTPGTEQSEFLRRSVRIANRTPTPSSVKSRRRSVKPRRIEATKDLNQEVNDVVRMTRTMTTMSSAVDCYKGMAQGLRDSIEKNEISSVQDTSADGTDKKEAKGRKKKQNTPPKAK
ncbi:uncharacterized protein [Antedon mediterranea]|uniref:uncharacterized protein n=1 Tax=Antedon mediterranea TaxID=105859 RepID=UPI003AF57A2A